MNVNVYDTVVLTHGGELMHFDVLLPQGAQDQARAAAIGWLGGMGITPAEIALNRCNYCHSEMTDGSAARHIEQHGWLVVPIEGCPEPAFN